VPVAIIGIGCMFAKAADHGRYWANIKNRVDAITDVPPTHWRPEDYLDKDPKAPDRTYAARGGFLSPVDFPPLDFGITPNTLEAIDTTQLLGLMVARDALEDAGYGAQRTFDRNRVSVILGVTGALELVIPLGARLGHPLWRRALSEAGVPEAQANDVIRRIGDSYVGWQEDSFPGLLGNVVAGRIANRLDLGGTNCVVDAACASSLSALHLGMLELATGRSDMVLSGGMDAFNDIFMYMCFSKTPALSPTGNARPFDARGDGTILGEGVGIVVLKRLIDAERDGDRIYAVIRGLGSSSDGKGHAIYAPSAAGQAKALRTAYRLAGVTPADIDLVEAHGTGTRAGDATEITALSEVYGSVERSGPGCAVGSVKSQIGHTKAAAGVAGLIKAALALHHKVLPPTIKVDQPIEALKAEGPLYLNTEARPWLPRTGTPRRAAVSSFGFGGSNFHCVLEEHRAVKDRIDWDGEVQIVPFAADTREQLAAALSAWPVTQAWDDVRREAARARASFSQVKACRLLLVLEREKTDIAKLIASARTLLEKQAGKPSWSSPEGIYFGSGPVRGKLAMLFPGQGSQAVGMFRDLAVQFPQVQQALAEADAAGGNGPRLSDRIYPRPVFNDADRARLEEVLRATDIAQPALGAVALGGLRVLEHFSVRPEATAGHSYGELVALHAAGCFDAATLHRLSRTRGKLMAEGSGDRGAMLAVLGPRAAVEKVLRELNTSLIVANHNAPSQVVLSGATAEVTRVAEAFQGRGMQAKRLPVAAAFHSPAVAEARRGFEQALAGVTFAPPRVPVYANTTGQECPHDPNEARSLLANQLARPVEFVAEIENMYQSGVRTFLEVGAGNKLSGMVGAILEGRDHAALALDASAGKRSGTADLARALSQLIALGHRVALTRWEEGAEPARAARKSMLTVPICGANYVKPRPSAPPPAPAPKPAVAAPVEVKPAAPTRSEKIETEKRNVETQPAAVVSRPRLEVVKPISEPKAIPAPMPAPAENASESRALLVTQDNLLALQRLGEQTAQLHRQFLEGQDKALTIFQTLLDQQQRLLGSGIGMAQPMAALPAPTPAPVVVAATPVASPPPVVPAPRAVPTPVAAPASRPAPAPVAAPTPIPVAAPVAAAPPPPAPAPIANGRVQGLLLAVVAEKTGYPAEMLELDMELDSDLGIDSIKRVEIFSAIQERLPEAPTLQAEQLGTLRSLRHVVDFLCNGSGKAAAAPTAPAPTPVAAEAAPGLNGQAAADVLLQVVAEKTGYPAEMLELDMELDSDLGIDSIKRVEIFSAIQERLPEAPTLQAEQLGTLRSLRHVVEFLSSNAPATGKATQPVAPATKVVEVPIVQETPLHRYVLATEPLSGERPLVALASDGEIWVTEDGTGLAANVARRLDVLGYRARLIGKDPMSPARPARLAGLVIVAPPTESNDAFLAQAFALLQGAGPALRQTAKAGGALLATVARLDGAFGLTSGTGNILSGGLAGMTKTAAHEWPEVQCKALDLAADWGVADDAVLELVEEILRSGPIEVGLSPRGKVNLTLTEVPLAGTAGVAPLSKGEVVVVTGGARGVTAEVAVALAKTYAPALVVLGRSPAPGPEASWLAPLVEESAIKRALMERANGHGTPKDLAEQYRQVAANREVARNIERMQAAGSRVIYRSVDVRDAGAVQSAIAAIRTECGPIRGLVHGAGVLADRAIEDKTPEQFELVYATKVNGVRGLLQAILPQELKALVLFSSSTGRFGRKGQVDYAVANEVLNKIAQQQARRLPGCRVVSVNWGPWAGGMVTPSLQKVFEQESVGLIPLKAGADYLVRELAQVDRAVETVVLASPLAVKAPESKPQRAVLSDVALVCAFERELDVESHPFLQSHVVDGHAVLPLAVIVEWLAHGAMHGNPGLAFHGVEELRVLKGVILDDAQPRSLRVLAGRATRHESIYRVPVEMRSRGRDGRDVLHARSEVLLATPLPPAEGTVPEVAGSAYCRSPRECYHDLLFHGPALQGIEQVERCSPLGIIALVKAAPAPSSWIRQPLRTQWLADPLALDCAFQMLILWSFDQVGHGSLPTFVGRYRQFQRSFPRDGVRIVAAVKQQGRQQVRADIAFVDRAGRVVARMDDYEAVIDASLAPCFRRNRLAQDAVAT